MKVELAPARAVDPLAAGSMRDLLRGINEHVTRTFGPHASLSDEFDYVCECTDLDCGTTVQLSPHQYARIMKRDAWFVVAPGHISRSEQVVESGTRYAVVMQQPVLA